MSCATNYIYLGQGTPQVIYFCQNFRVSIWWNTDTHTHTHTHTYTNTHTHMQIHIYIHTYVNTHTYIHTFVHTHTYTYTHTHTVTHHAWLSLTYHCETSESFADLAKPARTILRRNFCKIRKTFAFFTRFGRVASNYFVAMIVAQMTELRYSGTHTHTYTDTHTHT